MSPALPADSPFAQTLAELRGELNDRVRRRLKAGESIDGSGLLAHIKDRIRPIFDAVACEYPERSRGIVLPLVEVSLDLFAASLLGPGATNNTLDRVWRDILTACPRLIAFSPTQVAASLSNVAHRVATQANARPEEWLALMRAAAARAGATVELLNAAAVAAWRSGLAQYRASALDLLLALSPSVAVAALGTRREFTADSLAAFVESLRDDVWQRVDDESVCDFNSTSATSMQRESALRSTAPQSVLAGDFLGFGGPFTQPPRLLQVAGRVYVTDNVGCWLVHADAYGVFFQRATPLPESVMSRPPRSTVLDEHGTARVGGVEYRWPQWARSTSHAWTGTTLAVTLASSYHVFLVPLRGVTT